jgi:hypothetical protein
MKTFAPVSVTVTSSRTIRQPSKIVYYKIEAKRSLLKCF